IRGKKLRQSYGDSTSTDHIKATFSDELSGSESINESAVEDDDQESDWEDLEDEPGSIEVSNGFQDPMLFPRVSGNQNTTSRHSLISSMLAHSEKLTSSLTASAPRPSFRRISVATTKPLVGEVGAGITGGDTLDTEPNFPAQPIEIPTRGASGQRSLSPRTTRRNMLASELTESLRRQLLWER
ncbi:DUF1752-domain-containing protein, partial [Thozetella sp. PMI_491]